MAVKELLRLVAGVICALVAVRTVAGQVRDPKTDFIQALAQFSTALDGAYGDEGSRIQSSLGAMDRGLEQWDRTITVYEAAMAADLNGAEPPLAARMHVALGGIYLDRSRISDALRELAAARQLDSRSLDAPTFQGLVYSQVASDPAAATEAFRTAVERDPGDPVRSYMLARHLLSTGALEQAGKVLQAFQSRWVPPAFGQSRTAGAAPFLRLGLVQEVAGVEPFFPPAAYAEGFVLLQEGAHERAMAQFKEAAARDPLMTHAVADKEPLGLAATAFRDGDIEAAVEHLEAAVSRAPNHSESYRILGQVYVADQQYAKGIDALGTAIRLSPVDERARLALADALSRNGQDAAAEKALRETLDVVPGSGRAHYELGRVYQRQGEYPQAVREFDAAVASRPLLGLNSLYHAMGAIYADQQNFDGAIAAYSKWVDVHPNDVNGHQKLGEMYVRQGRDEEAIAEFAVVLMLAPRQVEAYAAMGQLALRAGRYADVVDWSQRTLALDPLHTQARYALATSLIRVGKAEEGRKELQLFQRLQADETADRARQLEREGLKREAAVSSANRQYDKAVSLFRRVLEYDEKAGSAHLDLGVALVLAGQPTEAIEHFRTAVALNAPVEVHRHLAEAYAAVGDRESSQQERATYQRKKQEALKRK